LKEDIPIDDLLLAFVEEFFEYLSLLLELLVMIFEVDESVAEPESDFRTVLSL